MRGERLARQWKILQMLLSSREGLSAAELAARLGYSVRSVYRDLQALELAGFPLFASREGRRSRWALVEGFRHSTSIPFTAEELMALEFSGRLLVPLEGSVFERGWEAALAKIRAGLPEAALEFVERLRGSFTSQPGPVRDYGRCAAVLEVLQRAVGERRRVEMEYESLASGRSRRRVDPYGIFHHQGALYLVAYCHLRRAVRTFLLDRVRLAVETGEGFAVAEGFDLEGYLAGAFGVFRGEPVEIDLRFRGLAARYVRERVWHPSQRLQEEPGGVRLVLRVPLSAEVERFVLSWGAGCEVLRPGRLRRAVERALRRAAAFYRADPGPRPEPRKVVRYALKPARNKKPASPGQETPARVSKKVEDERQTPDGRGGGRKKK